MPTEMELTLEQTQQGVSYEVSNIRVISFTMKMEILLEPTSNKLMVERFDTSAGNPVKDVLLKLNLHDHRSILTDSKVYSKDVSGSEHVENGVIELYFVNTEYQLADIFTKALGRNRIEFLINKLGMRSFTPETLKQLADEVGE
ncbi:hypothetical protein Tco_0278464 [Tanacetum coccineum]